MNSHVLHAPRSSHRSPQSHKKRQAQGTTLGLLRRRLSIISLCNGSIPPSGEHHKPFRLTFHEEIAIFRLGRLGRGECNTSAHPESIPGPVRGGIAGLPSPLFGRIAQLARARLSHSRGHRFESCCAHFSTSPTTAERQIPIKTSVFRQSAAFACGPRMMPSLSLAASLCTAARPSPCPTIDRKRD